jgi:hypothetical protein
VVASASLVTDVSGAGILIITGVIGAGVLVQRVTVSRGTPTGRNGSKNALTGYLGYPLLERSAIYLEPVLTAAISGGGASVMVGSGGEDLWQDNDL